MFFLSRLWKFKKNLEVFKTCTLPGGNTGLVRDQTPHGFYILRQTSWFYTGTKSMNCLRKFTNKTTFALIFLLKSCGAANGNIHICTEEKLISPDA